MIITSVMLSRRDSSTRYWTLFKSCAAMVSPNPRRGGAPGVAIRVGRWTNIPFSLFPTQK
ncbi:hypothetical protein PIIN_11427 [Serendipita indica DSM 11827]|uniref:Uncharacterized protein n=1 Tax=Serendipita indica (strain DSM 11827) TaxID=1109443 RepID=G4U1K7_SERID|nr:hypothetical protein PIIN_11427 [Serendipita indica DSM 11827]